MQNLRDIRFRGKRISDGEWVYGSLIQKSNENGKTISFIVPDLPTSKEPDEFWSAVMWLVDSETVGQFTGIYDIEESPIFEGDILLSAVKYDDIHQQGLCHVFYSDDDESFTGDVGFWIGIGYPSDYRWKQLSNYEYQFYRVIGNVHDDPYLHYYDFEDNGEAKFTLDWGWNDDDEKQLQKYIKQLKDDYIKRKKLNAYTKTRDYLHPRRMEAQKR